jgi:excisionase family DNA binding protein
MMKQKIAILIQPSENKSKMKETRSVLTVSELAKILRITERTLYRKVERKDIPYFLIGSTGSIRFQRAAINKWLGIQLV